MNVPTVLRFHDLAVRLTTAPGWPLPHAYRLSDLPAHYRVLVRVLARGAAMMGPSRLRGVLLPLSVGLFVQGALMTARRRGVSGAATGRLCAPSYGGTR